MVYMANPFVLISEEDKMNNHNYEDLFKKVLFFNLNFFKKKLFLFKERKLENLSE